MTQLSASAAPPADAPCPPGPMPAVGPLELSIVICTHNRADLLERLLHRLAAEAVGEPVEIIVVDSASAREAADRVRRSVEARPGCRLIRLETPGVSRARIAGVGAVNAPWFAFLDDDELPRPGWLREARALLRRLPSDCAACGGNVIPHFPAGRVPEIGPRWSAYLSTIDHRGEFDQTAKPQIGLGHSLIRTEAVAHVGGFEPRLGRTPGTLLSGEDVLLVQRWIDRGWRIWHSDRIVVDHAIEPERLTRPWVQRRAFWEGMTTARLLHIYDRRQARAKAAGVALKLLPLAVAALLLGRRREFDLRFAIALGIAAGFAGLAERLQRTPRPAERRQAA